MPNLSHRPAAAALAALLLASAPAAATTAPTLRAGSTTAAVETCHALGPPSERYAVFSAAMSAVPSTEHMAVRFDLAISAPHGAKRLSAPGLGVWQRSASHVSILRFRKEVLNLLLPGGYHATVRYRWYDPQGHVIRQAQRRTPDCEVSDPRPHLVVSSVLRRSTPSAGRARYDVQVVNRGESAAGPFDLLLTIDGAPQPTRQIAALGAGELRTVSLEGPECPAGRQLTVTADPAGAVDQSTRADATRTLAC